MSGIPGQDAGPKVLSLNHVALHVADSARSAAFYERVLRLAPLPRPGFSFAGAWFSLGPGQELHLIEDANYPLQAWHRRNHFALLIDDADRLARAFAWSGSERCEGQDTAGWGGADFFGRSGWAFCGALY